MPSIYDIKPKFQSLLRPLCVHLVTLGVTANKVTWFALLISALYGLLVVYYAPHYGVLFFMPFILFSRMALNAIDGMLAREFGQKSRSGAILNELSDVLSDTVLYLPLALFPLFSFEPVLCIVILAIICEMAGVTALAVGSMRRYDGPMGKSDRAFWIGALCLFCALGYQGVAVGIALWLIVILLILTIYNRVRGALQ